MLRAGLCVLAIVTLALAPAPAWAHGPRPSASSVERLDSVPVPVVSTVPGDVAPPAPRRELAPVGPPVARSTPGAVETIAVLIAMLGLTGLGRSWRHDRRSTLAAATAALLLGLVVETSPHLVHHSLDADQGASCEVLQTAERNQAAVDTLTTAPARAPAHLDERPPLVLAPALSSPAACGRAPPA